MSKKEPRTAQPEAEVPQPDPIPSPPGGGRWKWDEGTRTWLPNDQPKTTQTQE